MEPSPASPSALTRKILRDHRVDALRGLALLMMLVDHVPDDLLNRITIRNFGFADAAEIFVMLAGYASYLAYGRLIDREGWKTGIHRILARCLKLYLYQTGMTLVFVWTVRQWRHYQPLPEYTIEPQLAHGYSWLWRILTFDALPSYLNILPLYVVLLALFPLIYWILKRSLWLLVALSVGIWGIANLDPHLTIPNWLDPSGWYLNPFGWQFLYILGILGAVWASKNNGDLPYRLWVKALCLAYLAGAFVLCFPYEYWHVPSLRIFPAPPNMGKSTLAIWRLLDIMAIFYLVQSSAALRRISADRIGQSLALLGRNSLEVFACSTVLDLLGRLMFASFGINLWEQLVMNVVGLGLTYALAIPLDRVRQRARAARASSRSAAPATPASE
ncbi:OpgC domain-containing protein [Gluconobacter sp. LMG 1744]|uniref:OpgC family protein n=1 Tax=Gluconobacter TaxID=441 RepID=UPI0018853C3B|nr:OpgC domain-containing protein [Gluconobacter cadivus]MBF0891412.1 OpgC domain-containing protein [Gluconobacter cadivus]